MELTGHTVYMKRTHANGKTVKSEHRVWNSDLFFSAKIVEGQRDKNDLYAVKQITEREYKIK